MFTCRNVFLSVINSLKACNFDSKMPFYAVRIGKRPGIYPTWAECKAQVDKFAGARYKKFNTENEAEEFINAKDSPYVKALFERKDKRGGASSAKRNLDMSDRGGTSSYQSDIKPSSKLKVIDKEVEILQQQLKLKEAEKNVLLAKMQLDEIKEQCGDAPGKLKTIKRESHSAKPYRKVSSSSSKTKNLSSSSWKQNKVTQMIDLDEACQLHTAASTIKSEPEDSDVPVVYTDGACVNNGTDLARAGIGVYWGPGHPLNTSERLLGRQTNNRAEIFAVVKAVQQAKRQGFTELTVKTDSQFLINSITKWLPGWQAKGWKTATGKPVINKDDFQLLQHVSKGLKINWVHVRGHQGIAGNEEADRLAVQGANMPD